MDPLPADQAASLCGGRLESNGAGLPLRGASIDGRSVSPGDLFVALKGEKADGHAYAAQAEAHGAAAVLAAEGRSAELGLKGSAAVITCPEPAEGLWKLASACRSRLKAKVAAVTGSFGKTTTKDLLGALLEARGPAVKSPKSFNNALGLPLTILSAAGSTWAMALELGTNHPGEIRALAGLARPDLAVITGLGSAHAGLLGGRAGILKEKMDLPRALSPEGWAVLPEGDPGLDAEAKSLRCRVLRFGSGPDADLILTEVREKGWEGLEFNLRREGRCATVRLRRLGAFQARNAAAAVLAALCLGYRLDEAAEVLGRLPEAEGGRMSPRRLGEVRVLDDSYNSNPEAARAALQAFAALPGSPRVAVLGDMLELGDSSAGEHRELGRLAKESGVDAVLAVGDWSGDLAAGARDAGLADVETHADWSSAARSLRARRRPGLSVLLKGSRRLGLERILKEWEA